MASGLRKLARRLVAASAAAAAVVVLGQPAVAGLEVKWKDVRNPFFGNALYNLYQDKNFTGLVKLTAALEQNKIPDQIDEAEVARVMLLLSYGQHRTASARLIDLLTKERVHEDVRNHIWFYLAKIRYQRGFFNQAEGALANITGALPWELEQQLQAFSALLLMDRRQYPMAVRVLSDVKGRTGGVPFARFNMGVSHLKADKESDALPLLENIARMEVTNDETRALRDRANNALGFIYMHKKEPEKARGHFEQVHLQGPDSNEALLGLGWSHYVGGNFERALVPWIELTGRNPAETTVQEALVAVPFTFAKLEGYVQAIEYYEKALKTLKAENARVDAIMASVKRGEYFDVLLDQRYDGEAGWMGDVQQLPVAPESYYFTQMLSRHDYQEALKNYRDLRFLQERLISWNNKIDAFEDASNTWVRDVDARAAKLGDVAQTENIKRLRNLYDAYLREQVRVEEGRDAMALATVEEQEKLARLDELAAQVQLVADTALAARYNKRIALMRGRVQWKVRGEFSSRLHALKDTMKEIDQAILDAASRQNNLQGVSKGAHYTAQTYGRRFNELRTRIRVMQPNVDQALKEAEVYLKQFALEDLERRKHIVEQFLAQVSFSVGQTHDQAGGGKKRK